MNMMIYLKNFKKKERNILKKFAKYNIYTCISTDEALKLVERKKYNKIILISNAGINYEGRNFVNKERKIIGNDVIALFVCYNHIILIGLKHIKMLFF